MTESPWKSLAPDIAQFLAAYDRSRDGGCFAESFLSADPRRATVVDRNALVAALPARRTMFARAGVGAIHRTRASQLDLDALHVLVTAVWTADRAGADPLLLESTFLVRREPDGPRILVYLNHRDIATELAGD